MSEGRGFGGFLLGVAVGAVVGFLFAPEAGEDTRRRLSKRLKNLRDTAEAKVDEVRGLMEAEEEETDEAPRSTREELQRRLQAARRRRRAPAAEIEEGDEPVA
ncbi:MAG TPA: YtxH domain-containing protein [Gemmatimonadales bacterium]|nr:YtxH domain-containing protein [Gemmatimonadales bacterium]